jgi:hypothetical protein
MIAHRLQHLRIERTSRWGEAWERREVANGARTDELVRAVCWCKEPAIRDAVRSIFQRTGDIHILLAALSGIDQSDENLILPRIESLLKQVPRKENFVHGHGYHLLVAAEQRLGSAAKPLFFSYLKDAGAMRCYSVCEVLKRTNGDWAIELLRPLLADKRVVRGYTHRAAEGDNENSVPMRVCDAVAEALSMQHPELKFEMIGTDRQLDEQIKVIRAQLERKKR